MVKKIKLINNLTRLFMESPQAVEQRPRAGAPPEPVAPRGRPWVKGQSGNPAGRPSRARQAAIVAEALIQRKTVPLTNKVLELALGGDRIALRACVDRIAPRAASRRSIWTCRRSTAALTFSRR
jgi:hypothetical protein